MGWNKILIYERRAIDREAMRRALAERNIDAEVVDDTPAFEKAFEWWKPDAIVVGLRFPGFSGPDLITALKTRPAVPPVILVGALVAESLDILARQCGADGSYSSLRGYGGLARYLEGRSRSEPGDDGSTGW